MSKYNVQNTITWGPCVLNANLLTFTKNTAYVAQYLYLVKCSKNALNIWGTWREHQLFEQTANWNHWLKQNVILHKNSSFSPQVKQKNQWSSGNVKWHSHCGRQYGNFSKNYRVFQQFHFWRLTQKNWKHELQERFAHSSMIHNSRKAEWINNTWYLPTVD